MINKDLFNKFFARIVGNCNSDSHVRRADYWRAVNYLRRYQKGNSIMDILEAYQDIKSTKITQRNYKLRSDLGIFMNWYTIQLES